VPVASRRWVAAVVVLSVAEGGVSASVPELFLLAI
jgi:hypothetical protein